MKLVRMPKTRRLHTETESDKQRGVNYQTTDRRLKETDRHRQPDPKNQEQRLFQR